MTLGQRSMIGAFVLTVLLSVALALSSLGQYILIADIIALPVLYCLWQVIDRKARAFWIVFTYEHSSFLRDAGFKMDYYVPLDAQPKQIHSVDYEQPQAQYTR